MSNDWPAPRQATTHLGAIDYRDIGEGPVLVFLHPILAASNHWQRVVDRLSDRHRCIVVDLPLGAHRLPAHKDAVLDPPGLAQAVTDLLDALDLVDVTLVGNDSGGAVAQIVAAAGTGRVSHLVLTNCDLYDEFPPRLFGYLKAVARIPGGCWTLAQSLRIRPVWKLPIAYGWLANDLDRDLVGQWAHALRASRGVQRDVGKVMRSIHPRHTNAAAEGLRAAGVPTLIAWGRNDRVFTLANAERLAAEVPDCRLELIDDARTFVCWDQPDRLAELIAGHVSGPPQHKVAETTSNRSRSHT